MWRASRPFPCGVSMRAAPRMRRPIPAQAASIRWHFLLRLFRMYHTHFQQRSNAASAAWNPSALVTPWFMKESAGFIAERNAERRLSVLVPLSEQPHCSRTAARQAAVALGVSERQVFTLVRRLRSSNGEPSLALGKTSSGGRGKSRLAPETEQTVHNAIVDLRRLAPNMPAPDLISEVRRSCVEQNLTPPSVSTVRRRIRHLATLSSPLFKSNEDESSHQDTVRSPRRPSAQDLDAKLLSALYEGVGQPDGWDRFLEALTSTYAGGKGAFLLHDPKAIAGLYVSGSGWDEDYLQRYNDHYLKINPWMTRIPTRPVGVAASADALFPQSALLETEFYNDWLRPQGLAAGHNIIVQRDGSRHMIVTILYPNATAEKDLDAVDRLQRLAPHLLRVSQLNRQIALLETRAQTAEAALDAQDTAVFLVDAASKILRMNEIAEKFAAHGDGLEINNGVLIAVAPTEGHTLRHLVADAARARHVIASPPGGVMRITRPSGKKPYEILVGPASGGGLLAGAGQPSAAVFGRDPESRRTTPLERLRQLYGLTHSEARLMRALLTEDTLDSASARFNVSKETLRSQLKSIFRKTGTRTQLELLRLALRGAWAVSE